MPRANKYRIEDQVWHITSRCQRRRFLLKFARDRRAWVSWLYEARKRYGLRVLDYNVTSNHIHLLAWDRGKGEIERSMQLVEGRTAQQFNRRKGRHGAFWEDCYHATAVDTDEHLVRCLVYIDLNMVRAGVVTHPSEWAAAGYHEIQQQRARKRIVDRAALSQLLGIKEEDLARVHGEWIQTRLDRGELTREAHWSAALAVGRRSFVESVQQALGRRGRYRHIEEAGGVFTLREAEAAYAADFNIENDRLARISA